MLTRLDEEVRETKSGKEIDKSSTLVTKKSKETPIEKEKDETESLCERLHPRPIFMR